MADISQRQNRLAAKTTVAVATENKNRPGENAAVPTTQRGGQPVIQNPGAVSTETAATLSKNIQDSLGNLSQVKKQVPANDNFENELENENLSEEENYIPQQQINYPQLVYENEDDEDEAEIENEKKYVHKPRFPYIVFCICILEWFGTMLFGILALVFSIPPLTPIGTGLTILMEFFEIIFSVYIFSWSVWYENKEARSFKLATTNFKKQIYIKRSSKVGRRAVLGLNIIPILNSLVPVNAFFVLRTYSAVKKEFNQQNR